jgi:hypothetical protein
MQSGKDAKTIFLAIKELLQKFLDSILDEEKVRRSAHGLF